MNYSTIILIIPYFGKLPAYFNTWLISAGANSTVDFLIFTDDETEFDFPSNVERVIWSFGKMKKLIQDKFEFEVCIEFPYKLCDFRPAYGEIFSEYIENYDFWGWCDIDLIFGNIRKYITEEILSNYAVIFGGGHLSIYKNRDDINAFYRTLDPKGCMEYRDVFSSPQLMAFDEYAMHNGGGMTAILQRNDIEIYGKSGIDTAADEFRARLYNKSIGYFYVFYKNGEVFLCNKKMKVEQLLFHFHTKKKYCEIEDDLNENCFYYLSPGKFKNEISKEFNIDIIKIGVRNVFKRIYVIMGEPQWRWIKRLLR